MKYTTDCYFHIGQTHLNRGRPCQDYAIADVHEGAAFAIVADGCSTGAKTDVGARVLALSTAAAIREHWSTNLTVQVDVVPLEIKVRQRVVMTGSQEILGLSQQDMLSTCVYQYVTPNGGYTHIQGDGVTVCRERSGSIWVCRYEWMDNKPFYPFYAKDHFAGFILNHGGNINAKRLTKECWKYNPDKGFEQLPGEEIALGEGVDGIVVPITAGQLENMNCFAVFTDGVAQIEGLDWKEAVVQLLAFKTIEGEFAKRRMIRVIKDAQKIGKGPQDDIAYAVILVVP